MFHARSLCRLSVCCIPKPLLFRTSPTRHFVGFMEMNLICLSLPMCAWLPHFYFSCSNLCFVYCSWCCALDSFVVFWFVAYQNLCYYAPLLFGIVSVLWRWSSSVCHFRCVHDCHISIFLELIFFCILYLVLRAKSVGRLLVCCIPKPLAIL